MVPKVRKVKKPKSGSIRRGAANVREGAAEVREGTTAVKKRPAADGGFQWRSAISFSAQSTSILLRTVLEELGIKFRRSNSERNYSQLYAIMPFPRVAYVFRFGISDPCELIIDLYDTYPTTSGVLTFIEIPELNDGNIEHARNILRALSSKLPRPPWKFTAVQRVQHGLLYPDILRARKNWQAIGIAD